MERHLAVVKGTIPPITREEKDALIRHLRTLLAESKELLIRATLCADDYWKVDAEAFLKDLPNHE